MRERHIQLLLAVYGDAHARDERGIDFFFHRVMRPEMFRDTRARGFRQGTRAFKHDVRGTALSPVQEFRVGDNFREHFAVAVLFHYFQESLGDFFGFRGSMVGERRIGGRLSVIFIRMLHDILLCTIADSRRPHADLRGPS